MNKEKFINICKMTQEELHNCILVELANYGYDIYEDSLWIFGIHDERDVLLTAHLDTVHKEPVREVKSGFLKGKEVLFSPQGIGGDDRCGVFLILELLEQGCRQPVLFCHDEEIGGIGSASFCKNPGSSEITGLMEEVKFIIELDRANRNDAVYYDCDNKDFSDFVETTIPYEFAFGSFSDISNLAPQFKVAAVNLSCGYYNPHTLQEYVVLDEMLDTLKYTKQLIEASKKENRFEYIEGFDRWYEYSCHNSYFGEDVTVHIEWIDAGRLMFADVFGQTETEAIGKFLIEHPYLRFNDIYIDIF